MSTIFDQPFCNILICWLFDIVKHIALVNKLFCVLVASRNWRMIEVVLCNILNVLSFVAQNVIVYYLYIV